VFCALPVGSYEQHGPHLPPTVDAEVAERVAREVAERLGGAPLPPVYYTCSAEHSSYPRTISVSCESFVPYIRDVLRSAADKCLRVVVIVGHGGAWDAVSMVARQLNYEMGPRVMPVNLWAYIGARDHAGSDETSVYLAVGGRLAGRVVETCEGDARLMRYMRVDRISRSGVVGCLRESEVSAERGAEMLRRALERLLAEVGEFLRMQV
jgi:creatinine amidohydrolase